VGKGGNVVQGKVTTWARRVAMADLKMDWFGCFGRNNKK
jgi:hypothetical protein